MKISAGHAASLGLNGLLIALVVVQWRAHTPDVVASPVLITTRSHPLIADAAISKSAPAVPTPVQIGVGWQQWIESLRGAGVPEDELASLVQADFDRRW